MTLVKPKAQTRLTVDEYLAFERAAEERHVYLDGQVFAMAGETDEHGDISMNLSLAVGNQLKGGPCRARAQNAKIRSGPLVTRGDSRKGMFSYPDLVVICGNVEHHDEHKDVILNPKVIVEILAPSTELFDRGEKFDRYQTYNPSMTDYLLVAQDQPRIEHFIRQPDGKWLLENIKGLNADLVIASFGCTLKLADVYERVTFPDLSQQP